MSKSSRISQQVPGAWTWLGPVLVLFAVGLFFVVRTGGRWAENDSAVFSQYIRTLISQHHLVPEDSPAYPNGYAFQAFSGFVLSLTGLEVSQLQQLVYPLLAMIVILPAWLLFREFSDSAYGATISTLLLCTQPEFLFVIIRSSHEKFTRVLMFICLLLLVRSFRPRLKAETIALHVILFYLCAFALTSNNSFLANSFFAAVTVALALGWALRLQGRMPLESQSVLHRLFYVSLTSIGLVFLFMFYVYPPAGINLFFLQDMWQRIAALFFEVDAVPTNTYGQVATAWINLPVYFVLTSANWALLLASFLIWLWQGWHWVRHSKAPATQSARLLWLLYCAFAFQGGLTIIADMGPGLAGNLQLRLFPSFAIVAVGIVGSALATWRPFSYSRQYRAALTALIGCFALFAALKATNEPLLSNKWMFYRDEEVIAARWTDGHLRSATFWTEFDERIRMAYWTAGEDRGNENRLGAFDLSPEMRALMISDVTRLRAQRLGRSLPVPYDAQRVYDNGAAELYRLRPVTPFQK